MTNGHPTREEDFELYALGSFDPAEADALESHLRACASCARKVAEARGRLAALSFASPRVEPSPAVKERLMRQVRAESQAPSTASASVRRIVPPEPLRARRPGWSAVLVPAYLMLFFATFYLWRQNIHLTKQLAVLGDSLDQTQKQLDYARSVAHLFEARDTITVSLAPMPGMANGSVKVMYNGKMGMLMYDGWIEPPPDDKSYQLWVVPMEGKPISVGVFNPATSDAAHWMTKVPEGIEAKAFAVTLEPAGGTPQPTGPMVMEGPAS